MSNCPTPHECGWGKPGSEPGDSLAKHLTVLFEYRNIHCITRQTNIHDWPCFLGRKSEWRSGSMLSARGRGRGRPSTAGKCQYYFFLQSPQTIFPSIRDKLLTSQTTRRRKKRHQSPLWQREAQRFPTTQRKMKIPSAAQRNLRILNLWWPSWRTSRQSPQ